MTSQIRHRYISLQIDRRILCDRTTTYDVIIFKFHMTRAIALPLSALPADAPVCSSNTYWVRCQPLPKAKRWPNRKQNSTSYECIDQTQRAERNANRRLLVNSVQEELNSINEYSFIAEIKTILRQKSQTNFY